MKITLATLLEVTPQQIFDQVAVHLLTQNAKSSVPADPEYPDQLRCLYRSGELQCAAGCLIDADEYSETMEDKRFLEVFATFKETHHPENWTGSLNIQLVQEMQNLHDHNPTENWKFCLRDLAVSSTVL